MQILLINPRASFLSEPAFVPPLGLLYLGAALGQANHEPRVVDLNLDGAKITGHDPKLIGVSVSTATFPAAKQIIAECRKEYPGVQVVVGGPHPSVRPRDAKLLGADLAVSGDAEPWALGFPGPMTVDTIPIPARHLVPIHEYKCTLDGEPATSLVTQRGCPFSCGFCSRWDAARKVRARHVDNVIEEVRQLKVLGFSALCFHDDEMNLLNERLLRLCSSLADENIRFKCNARADLLTERQADALAAAGCSWVCVGVESGNAGILRGVGKGTTPEINARARRLCRAAGIKFKAFVIVGLPSETRETVADTKHWLIENEVDDLTVTMFVPFPGSDVYEHPERYPIKFDVNYEHEALTFRGAAGLPLPHVVSTPGLSAEELAELPEQLESEVRRELRLNRTYQGVAA